MIEIDVVSKSYGGRPVVDRLSLSVGRGAFCVLLGSSGCGKSTTLRMINRLIAIDSGMIRVGGEDVTQIPAEALRRRIGYAIQSIGLFPHWTVEDNIATVPRLLNWRPPRVRDRVTELLELFRLDPAIYRGKFPHQLSGGEQQRVGVARALAADPPVLLMDEPFGAVDPIVRAGLQVELLGILRRLAKTVIFVTHDIDEAIRMGDLIAIMKDGKLVQYASPERILSVPLNAFVADFVGADRALKRLALITAGTAAIPAPAGPGAPVVTPSTSLRDVLSILLASGADTAAVAEAGRSPLGAVSLSMIRDRAVARNS
jgi:osmoprotectant transport system ATP-binding protein